MTATPRSTEQALRQILLLVGPPPGGILIEAIRDTAQMGLDAIRDPQSPQWEDCKVCGGDHWTRDHAPVPVPGLAVTGPVLWWCPAWGTLNATRYHGNAEPDDPNCGKVAYRRLLDHGGVG